MKLKVKRQRVKEQEKTQKSLSIFYLASFDFCLLTFAL